MNSKQRKTLEKIWEHPPRQDIKWINILSLIQGVGGEVIQGSGSRVKFIVNDVKGYFHAPHRNGANIDRGAVVDLKKFLENANIRPE